MPGVVGKRPGANKPKLFDSLDAVSLGRANPNPDVVVRKNGVVFDNPPAKAEVRKAPKKMATAKGAPTAQSKKAQRTGAMIMNKTSKRQGRVKRPKASSIPISKENQLG